MRWRELFFVPAIAAACSDPYAANEQQTANDGGADSSVDPSGDAGADGGPDAATDGAGADGAPSCRRSEATFSGSMPAGWATHVFGNGNTVAVDSDAGASALGSLRAAVGGVSGSYEEARIERTDP